MKIFAAWFLALLFSSSVLAQLSEKQIEETRAALQRAVDNYGKVYGAVLIEKQCAFLTNTEKQQLEDDLHTIQEEIPQDPAIQNMHLVVEDSAKEVASTPPFSECGRQSETLVRQASTLVAT